MDERNAAGFKTMPKHSYAYELELLARSVFEMDENEVKDTMFSADSIESGTFAEVLKALIEKKYESCSCFPKAVSDFYSRLHGRLGLEMKYLTPNEVRTWYEEFYALYKGAVTDDE